MMMVEQQRHVSAVPRIRRALALPIYAAALVLDVAAARAWPSRRMDRRRRLAWIDSPCMTLGRPLVSPGFGRCHGPVDWRQRMPISPRGEHQSFLDS
jgi:hypothetical protein